MYNFWTKEEEQLLIEKVNSGISYKEMSKFFINRTETALRKKALKLGFYNDYHPRKYTHNENFFSEPNLINSYFAGFISADGCIQLKQECCWNLSLNISHKDKIILENFKKYTKFTGLINDCIRKTSLSMNYYKYTYMNISSCKTWAQDLKNNYNIVPNKTLRQAPPNLENHEKWAFIIGLIDGDGSVGYYKCSESPNIRFFSGTYNMVEFIKKSFDSLISVNREIYNGKTCYEYGVSGLNAAIIIDFLRQIPVPKLERKWYKPAITEYINQKKQQYPEKFIKLNIP